MRQKLTQEQLLQGLGKLALALLAVLLLGSLFFMVISSAAGAILVKLVP